MSDIVLIYTKQKVFSFSSEITLELVFFGMTTHRFTKTTPVKHSDFIRICSWKWY